MELNTKLRPISPKHLQRAEERVTELKAQLQTAIAIRDREERQLIRWEVAALAHVYSSRQFDDIIIFSPREGRYEVTILIRDYFDVREAGAATLPDILDLASEILHSLPRKQD